MSREATSGARRASARLLPMGALYIVGLVGVLTATPAAAQDIGGFLESFSETLGDAPAGSDDAAELSGRLIQLFALITVLSVAPGLLVTVTSFTRFVIVFSMLRSALGLNQTPPNIVITSLALMMTFFVMQPVFEEAWEDGVRPLLENEITEEEAIGRIGAPFHRFMRVNTREADLALFHQMTETADPLPEDRADISWRVLVPAFVISELKRAFEIGFLIYLPFIVIDLIVASITMAAGMMMLPPVMISLPFKIIFFVLIDGWHRLAGSMMQSYAGV